MRSKKEELPRLFQLWAQIVGDDDPKQKEEVKK
jgi:hypothetical protein